MNNTKGPNTRITTDVYKKSKTIPYKVRWYENEFNLGATLCKYEESIVVLVGGKGKEKI